MSTRTPLHSGYILYNENADIILDDVIGAGGSSIVYNAHYFDKNGICHLVRIKELFPKRGEYSRNPDGTVESDGNREKFEKSFIDAALLQSKLRKDLKLTNSTFDLQYIIEANGTLYSVMEYLDGVCLSELPITDVSGYLDILRQVCESVAVYHSHGYLHLDIKPENIYCLKTPGGNKVLLFDFDSVIEKDMLQEPDAVIISTNGYAAPEITHPNRQRISEKTDFFSIGAMLFAKVFGQTPDERKDYFNFSVRKREDATNFIYGTTDEFFSALCCFFKQTVCVSAFRFSNDCEICAALEELIKLSEVKLPYITTSFSVPFAYFIGRETELDRIDELFRNTNCVVLGGVGGIGKSVLAANYAKINSAKYDAIIFARYNGSFEEMFLDDGIFMIANFGRNKGEDDKSYCKRKLKCFNELCSTKILIIIDNCDEYDCQEFEKWMNWLPCRKIITTRSAFRHENTKYLEIFGLEKCRELFRHYCSLDFSEENEQAVTEILSFTEFHTLTVELVAKLINYTKTDPITVFERLKKFKMNTIGDENIRLGKDKQLMRRSVSGHIDALFDLSDFSDGELYILSCLAVVSIRGINTKLFFDLCKINSRKALDSLVERGLIYETADPTLLSLHPLIIDRILYHYRPDADRLEPLILSLTEYISNFPAEPDEEEMEYILKHRITVCDEIIPRIKGQSCALAELIAWSGIIRAGISCENEQNLEYLSKAENMFDFLNGKLAYMLKGVKYCCNIIVCCDQFEDISSEIFEELFKSLDGLWLEKGHISAYELMMIGKLCSRAAELTALLYDDECKSILDHAEKFLKAAEGHSENSSRKNYISTMLHNMYTNFMFPWSREYDAIEYNDFNSPSVWIDGELINFEMGFYEKMAVKIGDYIENKRSLSDQMELVENIMEYRKSTGEKIGNHLLISRIAQIYRENGNDDMEFQILLEDNDIYSCPDLVHNRYKVGDIYAAKEFADRFIEYCVGELKEDPFGYNHAYLIIAYALRALICNSASEANEWHKKIVKVTNDFLDTWDTTYDFADCAGELVNLSLKFPEHRKEYMCFAAALTHSRPREMTPEFYEELTSYIIGDEISSRQKYYACLSVAEYYCDKYNNENKINFAEYYDMASAAGVQAFGGSDYRTHCVMNKYNELSGTLKYAKEIDYRVLFECEASSELESNPSNPCNWVNCAESLFAANRISEVNELLEELEKNVMQLYERDVIKFISTFKHLSCAYCNKNYKLRNADEFAAALAAAEKYILLLRGIDDIKYMSGLDSLSDFYDLNKIYDKSVEYRLLELESKSGDIGGICNSIIRILNNFNGDIYVYLARMWSFLDEKYLYSEERQRFDIAKTGIDSAAELGDIQKEIYWLEKAESTFGSITDSRLRQDKYEIYNRLAKLYEQCGDTEHARAQKKFAIAFAPDGIYT